MSYGSSKSRLVDNVFCLANSLLAYAPKIKQLLWDTSYFYISLNAQHFESDCFNDLQAIYKCMGRTQTGKH